MCIKVIYNSLNDKKILGNLSAEFIKSESKEGIKIKSHWGSKKDPFVVIEDDSKIIKAFYSEEGNACNQLITWLSKLKN